MNPSVVFVKWLRAKSPSLYYKSLQVRSALTLGATKRAIESYLSNSTNPKLQLGSGRNYLEGWLNSDYLAKPPRFVYLNANRPFPFQDNRFNRIYSEHMIEHVSQNAGDQLLRESFRVLKPGGRIRLETPDLEKISALYGQKDDPGAQEYIQWSTKEHGSLGHAPTVCFAINNATKNYHHQFMYDEEMLRLMLGEAGFIKITRHKWNQTNDPEFANVSWRGFMKSSVYETIAMEAEKPKA